MDNKIVNRAADNMRILAAAMVEKAKSGHPGGAMGGIDFVNILYSEFLNYDPTDMTWTNRDRFFLDPGHMSPMLYSILCMTGNYSLDDLKDFRQWGSVTPGHPEVEVGRGVENTSGPLGQGHTMAVGAAIAERMLVARFGDWMSHKIYTFISDGGVQEEISQGAGRIAGHLGLNQLIMFYDSNDIQLSTGTDAVTTEDCKKKYEAWGWKVIEIEGNNPDAIRNALTEANAETEKPTLIIGKTIMGKGAVGTDGNSFEGEISTHGMPLSGAGADFGKTIENLGGNADNPFVIFDDVAEYYKQVRERKINAAALKKEEQKKWEAANPELSAKLEAFFKNEAPKVDYTKIQQKANNSTRGASSIVLSHFAETVENMIVSSADLSNSDKTDGFLKKTRALTSNDFGGKFLQAGVAELTMASIMNGIALHGGFIPACGTFFVFSDYMKPAVRIAALMELPVKYIWTHDAFRVGEDGPTHQPIEQEAQIRLLEELKNHSGRNSVLVLRPADAAETTVAWEMAMENTQTPTALLLSRQGIKDVPAYKSNRIDEAQGARWGAYTVMDCEGKPDIVLVGNGSEVSTLVAGAQKLKEEKGLKVRVVSAISQGLFFNQDKEYRERVLPNNVPKLGLTAGIPSSLLQLVGNEGKIIGLRHFGYSAPAGVLDEKFGYTAENVFNQAVELLN